MILCRIMASHLRHLALTRPPSNSCRKTKPKRRHEKVEPLKMGSAHVLSPEKDRNSTLYQWIKQSKKKNEKGTLIPFENQRRVARAAKTQQATLQKFQHRNYRNRFDPACRALITVILPLERKGLDAYHLKSITSDSTKSYPELNPRVKKAIMPKPLSLNRDMIMTRIKNIKMTLQTATRSRHGNCEIASKYY